MQPAQKAFIKYGIDKFKLYIYEYFTYESKIISHKLLTELETSYISKFYFNTLSNFSPIAYNNSGYKHTEESKLKISKPGSKNPMYGRRYQGSPSVTTWGGGDFYLKNKN